MKPVESNQQLIERFAKRTKQLQTRLEELQESYDEYVKLEGDLKRLEGSMQVVQYLEFGRLPGDGNHDGMKDHKPHG
ncbi:MAG: hypothetical protein VW454_02140 [Pelagibacteraceae bacterium]